VPPKDQPANNHLLALGTAAVLAVFGAGFVRTQQAADRIEGASRRRPPAAPVAAPNNSADASVPSPAAPLMTEHAASGREQPAKGTTALVAKGKTEQPATSKTESPAKVKTEPKPDSTKAIAVAEVPVIRPTPVAADTTSIKAPIDSSIGVARDLKDGVYTGWGTSRHGDIESRVEIRNGRIISASIAQCLTMYSVYWIAALPPQVVKRQSPLVDIISGATESSNAFYDGIVEALKKAK
jgi:uncharacterized protein with FMN-binding domain